MARKFDNFFLR